MIFRETNTTMFLVPGLGFDIPTLRTTYGFINGYLRDNGWEATFKHPVFLLFKPPNLRQFGQYTQQEYSRNAGLVEDYDYEGGFVVLVYEFAREYLPEYRQFLKGKYSRFRKSYIAKLPPLEIVKSADGRITTQPTFPFMICTKSETMKKLWQERLADPRDPPFVWDEDDELWAPPKLILETLDIEKIKQLLEHKTS